MVKKNVLLVLVAAVITGGLWIGQAISQQATPPERPQRGDRAAARPTQEEMQQRMEQRRKDASEQMRKTLGASEEEWKVLQPKIEKVRNLSQQLQAGAMRGRFGGAGMGMRPDRPQPAADDAAARPQTPRRGRPQPAADDAAARPQTPKTDLVIKTEALSKLLEDKESKPEAVKAALIELRDAREKITKDLESAKKELREIVTVRQEAHLVLMSVLD